MCSDDEMIMHQLMDEEAIASVDEDVHLMILASLE
jgi:hypothetical protein